MATKKGLGRGFESLIPTDLLDESFDPTAGQDDKVSDLRHIKLDEIHPNPNQPRRHFDDEALDELAQSIAQHGVVQPIVVAPRQGGGYQIVAGERRWRGARIAGLEKIPALVRTLSDQHKLEVSLIENLQRRDLNIVETATAYLKLRDQFNLTLDEIGARVGNKSVSAISNTLRLLKLPQVVLQALAEGKLTEGQARPLIGLSGKDIASVLPKILSESWSARKIEQYIVALKESGETPKEKPASSVYASDEAALEKRFATPIQIRTSARGSGQIVIRFKDKREFERIKNLLK